MISIREQVSLDAPAWYAVSCKFRCERRIAQDLEAKGIEVYVPILKRTKQYASRKKKMNSTLIPSHVFVKIRRDSYIPVLQHDHVYKFLNFSGRLNKIPESQMNLMKRVVGEYDDVIIENIEYQEGDLVEIIHGELTGIKGTLVERTGHNLKIELSSLGMGLVIYVDPKFLIKTSSARINQTSSEVFGNVEYSNWDFRIKNLNYERP